MSGGIGEGRGRKRGRRRGDQFDPSLRGVPHPKGEDLYTPLNDEVLGMLQELRDYYGSWREVCNTVRLPMKTMRRLRFKQRKSVSMTLMDKILTTTVSRYRVDDFVWFTAHDLVALGIWDPVVLIADQVRRPVEEKKRGKGRRR